MQVLSGITDPELNILDAFEDFEYERRIVDVSLTVCQTKIIFNLLDNVVSFIIHLKVSTQTNMVKYFINAA